MSKLKEEDIKHVNNLARLNETDTDKYIKQLNDILSEIDKIIDVEIQEDNIMIVPNINENRYSKLENDEINKKDVLQMANNSNGEYLTVSRVIND